MSEFAFEIAEGTPLSDSYDGLDVAVVGGYTRDYFMGRNANDTDLVVTGVSPKELVDRGFDYIGAESFPVFLDQSGREVAIARTEESTGEGHTDFESNAVSPDTPHHEALREDLERRDLTMNAIAVDAHTGEIFDPFDGRADIENRVICHVSSAFADDPLRVYRAARYAARFGFEIMPETRELMADISADLTAQMEELTAEGEDFHDVYADPERDAPIPAPRFGLELMKAFKQAENPRRFFDVLKDVGGLKVGYPEVASLQGVPAGPREYHQEGSTYEHTMRVLMEMFDRRGNDEEALLAALSHDFGKAVTDETIEGRHHYGHHQYSSQLGERMYNRFEFEREYRGLMGTAARLHDGLGDVSDYTVTTLLDRANQLNDSRLSVEQLVALGEADAAGRTPEGEFDSEEATKLFEEAIAVISEIGGHEALNRRGYDQSDIESEIPGERVGNILRQDRAEALRGRL